jgi:TolB-like protein
LEDLKLIKSFYTICFFSLLILSGCSNKYEKTSQSEGLFQNASFTHPSNPVSLELKDYVRELVADMALNIRSADTLGVIAVTNFVFSESDFQSTNELGYVLADTFMMELHLLGFETLDFKVTDFIRVTSKGDFAMSRDYLELETEIPFKYILVGKLTDHKNGYLVHARIVDIKSKKVLAFGESFIPRKLVDMLVNVNSIQSTKAIAEVSE